MAQVKLEGTDWEEALDSPDKLSLKDDTEETSSGTTVPDKADPMHSDPEGGLLKGSQCSSDRFPDDGKSEDEKSDYQWTVVAVEYHFQWGVPQFASFDVNILMTIFGLD